MAKNKKVLLAVDVGTTNWKVAVFDLSGKLVCIEKTATKTHYDEKNQSYYKRQEVWEEVSKLIAAVVKKCDGDILGISVTSMAEAVVPIDKDGNECFDIITWFDTRSDREAEEIAKKVGREKLYSITGLDPNPIFSLCKMLWIKNNHPDVFDRSVKWLQMADYIIYKLSGVMVTDYTLASRTLAFDVPNNHWSNVILQTMQVDQLLLPEVAKSGTVVGNVTQKASNETGLSTDIPVVVGGNDHPCAALPAGVLKGSNALDSSGTAESIIMVSKKNSVPNMVFKGQRTCRFLDPERYALWGGIISSGASFEWIYRTLTSVREWGFEQPNYDYADVLSQVDDVTAGSNGLLFIPHLRGSGAPYWNPKMRGAFFGLKITTTQKQLMKAVMEGMSFQARMIVDMHKDISKTDLDALCVVGGSVKNIVWQQIKADILQMPVELYDEPEATALGAAMLAGIGAGVYASMEDAIESVTQRNKIIIPDSAKKSIYNDMYEVFKLAQTATTNVSERLHDISPY